MGEVTGYTRHGHPVEGIPQMGQPESVARCGGPRLCISCANDAIKLFEDYERTLPTPTTEEIRECWMGEDFPYYGKYRREMADQFDRWLRKIKQEAYQEGVTDCWAGEYLDFRD